MKKIEFLAKFGVTISATLTLTGEAALKRVSYDGYALRYVKDQTADICLKAVEKNAYALRYVKDQTTDICLKAVEKNGDALQYVKDQTTDICLKAVEKNAYALQYVNLDVFEDDDVAEFSMVPVSSSHIEAIGHMASTIRVRYKGGDLYEGNCSPELHASIMTAPSVGKALNTSGIKLTKIS